MAINIIPMLSKLLASIITISTGAIPNAIGAWKAYSSGIVSANTAISASIPLIGILVVAISALSMGINASNRAKEESIRLSKESIESNKQQIKSIEDSLKNLSDEKITREELLSVMSSYDESLQDEVSSIEDVNEARQKAIDLLQQEKKEKAQEILDTGYSAYVSGKKAIEDGTFRTFNAGDFAFMETQTDEEYLNNLKTIREYYVAFDNESGKYADVIAKIEAEINSATEAYNDHIFAINEYKNAQDLLSGNDSPIVEVENVSEIDIEPIINLEDALNSLDSQLSTISSLDLSGLTDAFDLVTKAMDELYSTSGLTVGTYEELLSLSAEYTMYLLDEEGVLRSTTDAQNALYSAKIDEMAMSQARQMINIASTMADEGESYAEATKDVEGYTSALWSNVYASVAKASLTNDDTLALTNQINTLEDWAKQAKANIGTYSGSTSAIKKTRQPSKITTMN